MPIIRFLREATFDQADIERMAAAYDAALSLLHLTNEDDIVCGLIAKKIIEITRDGEHDPPRICARALTELGIPLPD